jgi:hypothetical protein
MTTNPKLPESGSVSPPPETNPLVAVVASEAGRSATSEANGSEKIILPATPEQIAAALPRRSVIYIPRSEESTTRRLSAFTAVLGALLLMVLGGVINNSLLGLIGAGIALFISVRLLWNPLKRFLIQWATEPESAVLFAGLSLWLGYSNF